MYNSNQPIFKSSPVFFHSLKQDVAFSNKTGWKTLKAPLPVETDKVQNSARKEICDKENTMSQEFTCLEYKLHVKNITFHDQVIIVY